MCTEKPAEEYLGATSGQTSDRTPERWRLRLYVSGETPRSLTAYANLKNICEQYLVGSYLLEIVDLLEHPLLAREEGIVAVPTLVRLEPMPVCTIIGDLSDTDEVLQGLRLDAERSR